jgi:hypothetical protein
MYIGWCFFVFPISERKEPMALTPGGIAEVKVLSLQRPTYEHSFYEYLLDGELRIGVLPREEFAIEVTNQTKADIGYRISLDGRDVQTTRDAITDPFAGSYFMLSGGRTARHTVWREGLGGGARFMFTDERRSVATHTPGSLTARGTLSVIFFQEDFDQWPKETDSWGDMSSDSIQTDYGLSWGEDEVEEYPTLEQQSRSGVGAGEYRQERVRKVPGLVAPVYKGEFVTFRHTWWSVLLTKLQEANFTPTDVREITVPPGFVPSGVDLRGVPQMVRIAPTGYLRYHRTVPPNAR